MLGHAKALRTVQAGSKGLFYVGTAIGFTNGAVAAVNGDIPGVGKAAADVSIGTISLMGGLPGWTAGATYFAIDMTVGIEAATVPIADGMCKITGKC